MGLCSRERALELALALARESTALETEVTFEHGVERFARFAAEGATQSADRERFEIAVRVRLDDVEGLREARATVSGSTLEAGRAALARAMELARYSPPNRALVPLGGPVEVPRTLAEPSTLAHSFADKSRWIARALELCLPHFEPAGLLQSSALAKAIVNSRGRAVYGQTGRFAASLTWSASGATSSGLAEASIASDVTALDVDERVRVARSTTACSSRDPRPMEPADVRPWCSQPHAASALLLFAAYRGLLGAREVEEQHAPS
jgi:predicted Zn-dependent protease